MNKNHIEAYIVGLRESAREAADKYQVLKEKHKELLVLIEEYHKLLGETDQQLHRCIGIARFVAAEAETCGETDAAKEVDSIGQKLNERYEHLPRRVYLNTDEDDFV